MFVEGTNGVRPIGDGLLEVSDASLSNLISNDDINEIYDVEQAPFARGKFATVRRAMHKQNGVSFAAKFLRRRRRAQCTLKEIRHEIAILLLCADSKHIVKLHSVHETNVETALVLEMATGGELQTLLDEAGSLNEQQTIICMQEVLKALQFLHKKSIAHLDLKPQNILLCGKRVEDGLKLCDFGISRIVEESGSKVREILGTPDYVAPEVLSYEPLSLKTDIWSVGVLAYVLLSGFSPFGGDTKQETFLNISQCNLTFPDDLFQNVSDDAKDFIKSALQVTAEDRMSAKECLEHKWLCENQPLKAQTNDSIIADVTPNRNNLEGNINDTQKLNDANNQTLSTSPPKTSAGFFLHPHPNQNNGTSSLNELLFSNLNGSLSTSTHANLSASKPSSNDHFNHEIQQQQPHNQQHQPSSSSHSESLSSLNVDICTNDSDCLKQTATTNNNCNNSNINCISNSSKSNNCGSSSCSYTTNKQNELLKDYTTNKENINLSKILVNRIAPIQNQPSTQLINNLNKGITLNNNNHSTNNNLSSNCSTYDYTDEILATPNANNSNNISSMIQATPNSNGTTAMASVPSGQQQQQQQPATANTKYESILFPDAPTTPKVSRKSIVELETPSCVTLVKQFQLSNPNRIDFDEITVPEQKAYTASKPSTPNANGKFAAFNDDCVPPTSYRLSGTTLTAPNHHRSLASSTLSMNTMTETAVGVTTTSSNSTINCLCGADKSANCCCTSRTALNYRKKSLAVLDSSILC